VYLEEARAWVDWMDQHHLSSCNWSMFNKDESASALSPNGSNTGPWSEGMLSASGTFVKSYIIGTLPGRAGGTKAP
jgi:endoglucanase